MIRPYDTLPALVLLLLAGCDAARPDGVERADPHGIRVRRLD